MCASEIDVHDCARGGLSEIDYASHTPTLLGRRQEGCVAKSELVLQIMNQWRRLQINL
jgi:hypothetical protein